VRGGELRVEVGGGVGAGSRLGKEVGRGGVGGGGLGGWKVEKRCWMRCLVSLLSRSCCLMTSLKVGYVLHEEKDSQF